MSTAVYAGAMFEEANPQPGFRAVHYRALRPASGADRERGPVEPEDPIFTAAAAALARGR